jgi:osmotically-inducible protein OsmY
MHLTKGFILGVGTAYFLDPTQGRTRRRKLVDRSARLGRRAARFAGKKVRFTAGKLRGVAATVVPSHEQRRTDDATVLQRIRSEALRDVGVPAQDIDVRVENGIATLRGSVADAKLADDLLVRVRKVEGVEDVTPMIRVGADAPEAA